MEGVVSPSSNHLPSVRAIVYNSDQICFPQGGGPEVLFRRAPAPRTMRWGRGPPTPPTWRASTTHLTAKRDGDTLRMGGSTALETRRPPRSRTRTAHRIAMDRSLTRTRRRQQARPDVSAGARTTAERQWFNGVFFFFLPPACPVRTGCLTISDNWGGAGGTAASLAHNGLTSRVWDTNARRCPRFLCVRFARTAHRERSNESSRCHRFMQRTEMTGAL